MGKLSTHVLDTAQGRPAAGLAVRLERLDTERGRVCLTSRLTNSDGRTDEPLLEGGALVPGIYELTFAVGDYFRSQGLSPASPPFLDEVPVRFGISDASASYHIPLLCSPWAYQTYRGS
ncbi:MAG: hydroxyisourate hydrolase [Terrimicrobiaceae bacterium]|nr:hydroxyisourate hydrolase [Terrimicrobiaceae bacterium]